ARLAAWAGGRRRARRAKRALRVNVEQVARDLVLDPIGDEVTRYRDFTEAVTDACAENGKRSR
ncbi:ABC transporter, partial [Streptosporangium algeriense]